MAVKWLLNNKNPLRPQKKNGETAKRASDDKDAGAKEGSEYALGRGLRKPAGRGGAGRSLQRAMPHQRRQGRRCASPPRPRPRAAACPDARSKGICIAAAVARSAVVARVFITSRRHGPPAAPPAGNHAFETLSAALDCIDSPFIRAVFWMQADASRAGFADEQGRKVGCCCFVVVMVRLVSGPGTLAGYWVALWMQPTYTACQILRNNPPWYCVCAAAAAAAAAQGTRGARRGAARGALCAPHSLCVPPPPPGPRSSCGCCSSTRSGTRSCGPTRTRW